MDLTPKRAADSVTEMVQVVLPNDANPLGFILGGTVMHLIDIAGAIACHRHTRTLLVTAAVDFLGALVSMVARRLYGRCKRQGDHWLAGNREGSDLRQAIV